MNDALTRQPRQPPRDRGCGGRLLDRLFVTRSHPNVTFNNPGPDTAKAKFDSPAGSAPRYTVATHSSVCETGDCHDEGIPRSTPFGNRETTGVVAVSGQTEKSFAPTAKAYISDWLE